MKFVKKIKNFAQARTGILTNHTGYGWKGDYHFRSLSKILDVRRIFVPEHGLFAELQDQVSGSDLKYFDESLEFWNIYGDTEESLVPPDDKLLDLEIIIIDIRDVGARYYTFLTSANYILNKLSVLQKSGKQVPKILIFDSANPIGNKVEGSPLRKGYSSFVGVEDVLHRHGLTPAGLLSYYNDSLSYNLEIFVAPVGFFHPKEFNMLNWIPPSPNIPSLTSCLVYPGQCLLEGTNISEGRGTTRPFEIFGAEYIDPFESPIKKRLEENSQDSFYLRPLRYVPTFHKFKNQICGGFQIHVTNPKKFRSLNFTLDLIRIVREVYPKNFQYLDGVYEFRSDRPAIELLVGDPILLDYINGGQDRKEIMNYLEFEESEWKQKIKPYRYLKNSDFFA
ncbi:DUF1343 domain-containing protein [Leptospira sp. GIMC2001]|uniref:DUF1343 domain-containing protein n=1 Tax=Leptospira sp. GIMC2001 TaxID=1513297 RepID=UPI00234960EE|nr:DUF1343 domain-containing protein [Leptospira sp. GIMC2001]WCL48897.1 DUF1343 domain-containing protein [Leptospira sp. GIMC2001]